MAAYSPAAIRGCYDLVKAAVPSAQLSGIYANKPGYHNARQNLPGSDYSVQRAQDKQGDSAAAAALDITLQPAEMKAFTQRLIDATQRGDTRLRAVREFFGTVNGTTVTGMDVPGKYWVTSDPSHLWHIHLSSNRSHTNDTNAWQDVAAVLLGTSGGGSAGGTTGDDMPKQIYLTSGSGQKTTLAKAGTYYPVGWNKAQANTGGVSLVLPDAATLFDMTAWLNASGLGDGRLYWRVQTLDRNGKQLALYPVGEEQGASFVVLGQVGTVAKKTNLRLLVSANKANVTITSAWWRCLYW